MTNNKLSRPAPISSEHDVSEFSCGNPALDRWLQQHALNNQFADASRTFVVCDGRIVVAYYALASGAIARSSAPRSVQRNMPDPIPVTILGRIAVDSRYQGSGLGTELIRDAYLRCLSASEIVASKAVLVHAISAEARTWYLHEGFIESPDDPMTLCIPLASIRKSL